MSRIGRKPLEIPKGVTVSITKDTVQVKGPKGTLSLKKNPEVEVKQAKDEGKDVLVFERAGNLGPQRAAHGFTRQLEINGVGYKAEIKGNKITFSLGFSHPVDYTLPEGISAKTDKNLLILSGIDRQALGAAAAEIRGFRPPEPYKGKGIKYV